MPCLSLGDVRVDAVVDIDPFPLPLNFIFPSAQPEMLAPERRWLDPLHMAGDDILLSVHSLVLRVDSRVILIDTCVGEHKPRPRRADWNERTASGYLERLAALGLRPEDVDTVFCTHLHADHVGWNTQLRDGRWVPTFPKARYLVGRGELAHWAGLADAAANAPANHGSYFDSVLPVLEAGLVDPVDDGFDVHHGLSLSALPGHTPGHMGLWVDRQDRALFVGDALHSPVQFVNPDWSSAFCTDPAQSAATRRQFLDQVVDADAWLVPSHLRGVPGCRLKRHGTQYRML